ncbi:MAG: NADP-dependent malic enzyme [Cellulosilyticaceae bacterium]
MDIRETALEMHEKWQGKLEIKSKASVDTKEALSIAYTPGVAEPCKEIVANRENVYKYTMKGNTVAVISNGTAVLGLGDIGPEAGLPVMEGKAVLFKEFSGINAIPICINARSVDEVVTFVKQIAPTFGGINLEDIAAPMCFEIEERLKEELDIPVFHDDQHGTAIVVLAGMINSLRLVRKNKTEVKVVVNGAGSAGTAITKLLLYYGFTNVILVDKNGILQEDELWMNWAQKEMCKVTNLNNIKGKLQDALQDADVFIGVSAPNIVTGEMIKSMNKDAIVFAMANPAPEIMPDLAKASGAKVVGTGRSDFPNQVNNVLVFPGIFKGALQSRATKITEDMKIAAALAIAGMIPDNELGEENILPKPFTKGIADYVAKAVIEAVR